MSIALRADLLFHAPTARSDEKTTMVRGSRPGWRHMMMCVGSSVLLAGPVWADAQPVRTLGAPAIAVADEEAARRYYDEGAKAARTGNWEKAREAFQKALRIKPDPVAAGRLGEAALHTGRYVEAAHHLTWFLRDATAANPVHRQAAEKMLAEAKAKIGTVTVRVDVAEAEVLVDGRPLGKSPLAAPVFVEPGSRMFEAQKEGHGRVGKPLDVAAGSAPEVALSLAMPPREPVAQQQVATPTPPNAEKPVQPRSAPVPPLAQGHPKKVLIYTGIAVTGALAVVGGGTAIGSSVKASEGKDTFPDKCQPYAACKQRYMDLEDQRALLANTAFWSFIGAGVVGAGTVAYWLLGNKLNSTRAPQAAVMVSPAGGGVVMTGSW